MPCANDTEQEAVVSLLSSSGDRWLEVREREREREREALALVLNL